MEAEFKAIIEKNLPAQVGDVLKKRLEQADVDASNLKRANETLDANGKTITSLNAQIAEYKKFDERNAAISAREIAVTESERNLKVKELEFQLASEKDKTGFAKEVALGLVRNTEYRKTIFDNESQSGYYDGKGNYIQPGNINKNLSETSAAG